MEKQLFDLDWEFTEATGMFASVIAKWQHVNLPHDLAITKPRNRNYPTEKDGGYAWSGIVTYRKNFQVPEEWRGKSIQVEFEGIYMNAEVSINRQLVAMHPYGYTSFMVDLTPYIKYGEENTLQVVANNSAQPNSRWYSGTGIYRHAWLRLGGAIHIQPWGVFVTTPLVDSAQSTVVVTTEVAGNLAGAMLRSTILDSVGTVIQQVEDPITDTTILQTLAVKNVELWSVDHPILYTIVSEVFVDGLVVDTERTPFGIRSISIDAQHGFSLNGVSMKLRGGCIHHDHGLLGAASYDRAEQRKVELLKASGFNAIRCSHNPPAPALLDACDRLGMLVIDESFDCWRTGKNPNDYHLYFEDWWQRDTESMVRRDRNHPSIILWSIGNEVPERLGLSNGYAWVNKQADFVHGLDPSRPVTSALHFPYEDFMGNAPKGMNVNLDVSPMIMLDLKKIVLEDPTLDIWNDRTAAFCDALDVVGYNYLEYHYEIDHQVFPARIMVGTETYPFIAYDSWKKTEQLPYVIGDFVWTAVDYLGESGLGKVTVDDPRPYLFINPWPIHLANSGDIDICGFKRPQSYFRDLLWGVRSEPFIAVMDPQICGKKVQFGPWGWDPVIDSWSFPGQEGKPTRVDVYAVDDEVELLVNGVSAGRKPAGAAQKNKTSFEVTYQPGTIEVIGYQDGKAINRTSLCTAGDAVAIRLTADRAGIKSNYGDLVYVAVEVVDSLGNVVRFAEPEINFEISGAGNLLAVGSADPQTEELCAGTTHKAWQGRMMAVICSVGQPGEILVQANSDGLVPGTLRLRAA